MNADTASTDTPILYNCQRHDDEVLVRSGNEIVALPNGPRPTPVDEPIDEHNLLVRAGPGTGPTVTLKASEARCEATISLPPPTPGVLYLVDEEIVLRFPHRTDFVTPGVYEWIVDAPDDESQMVLAGVYTAIHTVDATGVPNIDVDEEDPPSDQG